MNTSTPPLLLARTQRSAAKKSTRSIGEILVEAGVLDAGAAERIAEVQRTRGLRFGDAAMQLKMLTLADIEFALAKQFEYPYLDASDTSVSPQVVAAFRPFGPFAEQMRSLRTSLQILRTAQPLTPATVGIVSAGPKEGRSMIAANLAVSFSQMGEKTLLVDADLRSPAQHRLFNIPSSLGLSNILLGRADTSCIARVPHFFDLSVLNAGSTPPNPQELLTRSRLSALLEEVSEAYDVVIIDTPAIGQYSDARIVASRAGMNVLVARKGQTDARALARAHSTLVGCGARIVGTVMNDG